MADQQTEDRQKQGQFQASERSPLSCLALTLLFFVILYALYSASKEEKRITIPYSEFRAQLVRGNIDKITLKGTEIQGTFKKPYEVTGTLKNAKLSYSMFSAMKPSIDDPDLMKLLVEKNVTVNAEKSNFPEILALILGWLPWIFIIGYFIYVLKNLQGQIGMSRGDPIWKVGASRAKRFLKSKSSVTYSDVAGLENAKSDFQEIVDFLKDPERFKKLGAEIPRGILLVGPPGTGKTLLARATAGEADVPFFSSSGSEFVEMFVGVGAARVRDMFEMAKREAPSIIFIDEIDSVGRARGTGLGGSHDEREQTLNQILSEMDGFSAHETVIVISATNRPDVLDPALVRPGRFDRQITLDLPQKKAREKILRIHLRNVPTEDGVNLENLASRTVGLSGADLKNLVNEAALLAVSNRKEKVSDSEFDQAFDKVLLGNRREEMMGDEERRTVAYHESGHALMALLTPGADPLQKVTIIPRGRALGVTEQTPEEDRHNFTKDYLMKRISIMLGGRAAEKLVLNDITSGAADDLRSATKLARMMVARWGMSEKLGPATFSVGEEHPFLGREISTPKDFSETTARVLDEEIQGILNQMEERAMSTLDRNRGRLEMLAGALLEHETLENAEVQKILGIEADPGEELLPDNEGNGVLLEVPPEPEPVI